MSTPALLQPSPFQARLVLFLMPYFRAVTTDFELAREEILETLASYGARSRSEMIAAARIIAFSFSALDMLAEAKVTEMSASMRLRFRGCANGLNRACQQNEKALAKSLTCDRPNASQSKAEPIDDLPDAEVEAALQQTHTQIETYRNRASATRPAAGPRASQQDPNQRPWGSAMLAAIANQDPPIQPAAPA
jgi:hypothetical protein